MVEDVVVNAVELTLADLVARSRALLSSRDRVILGVAGAPGAGKSTVTAALTAALGEECVVVPMDGFHLSNEVLRGLGRRERKGAPDTFDVAGYRALLERLRAQEELVYAPGSTAGSRSRSGVLCRFPGGSRSSSQRGTISCTRSTGGTRFGPCSTRSGTSTFRSRRSSGDSSLVGWVMATPRMRRAAGSTESTHRTLTGFGATVIAPIS